MHIRINHSSIFLGTLAALVASGCGGNDNSSKSSTGGSTSTAGGQSTGGKGTTTSTSTSGGSSSTSTSTTVGGTAVGSSGTGTSTGMTTNAGGSTATTANTGGNSNAGGATGTTPSTGGSSNIGGSTNVGGTSVGTGGTNNAGTLAIGGTTTTGGSNAAGGATNMAGTSNTSGGIATAGGTAAAGGAPAVGGTTATGGNTATGGTSSTGGAQLTGGTTATGGAPLTGGASNTGGSLAAGGTSATGGVETTGGSVNTGGMTASGGTTNSAGSSGIPAYCSDNVTDGDESDKDCGGSCGSSCPPGAHCNSPADCAAYGCTNNTCDAYATSCTQLKQRGAPPDKYMIDTDGSDYMQPFIAYCPTVGSSLAPAGICQAESGATPACKSYVGALGFDFVGVDFGGSMTDGGLLQWEGQPVTGDQDVHALADGSILATTAYNYCCWSTDLSIRHYQVGTLNPSSLGMPSPQGIVELFDGKILVGGEGVYLTSTAISTSVSFHTTNSPYPAQLISGKIVLPSSSVNQVFVVNTDGSAVVTLSHAGFVAGTLWSALQLADGTVVFSVQGPNARLVFFDANLAAKTFTSAPDGMTLNSDGTLSRPSELSTSGPMIQLPNGQLLVANISSNSIVRLGADGSYVSTFTLPNGWSGPTGMTLDHRGRLLVATGTNHQSRVVTFPGCSDAVQNFGETGIDCGGTCTQKCGSGSGCNQNSDCTSGSCLFNYCE